MSTSSARSPARGTRAAIHVLIVSALSLPCPAALFAAQVGKPASPGQRPSAHQSTVATSLGGIPQTQRAAPVVTATTGRDQAGYVHYFVVTGPDGEPESQVAIELVDERVAWSFPGIGVITSPFMKSGTLLAGGNTYSIEHLYGIRPFQNERAMLDLQKELSKRIAPWLQHNTGYCSEEQAADDRCVSCLGFVLRVLYPGSYPEALPELPPDFKAVRKNLYTTEDLLLYLSGVQIDAPRELRVQKIQALSIPENMREELLRIASDIGEPAVPVRTPVETKREAANEAIRP